MQVSYGKLTVNDRKEMGERWLPSPCDDGCFATDSGARGMTSHNRTRSRCSIRSETAYFGGWRKFFTIWPAYKSLPQLL